MTPERPFRIIRDYEVPLLRLLADLPDGEGRAGDIVALFGTRYSAVIPAEHQGLRASTGGPIWANNVHWSRNHLRELGFVDPSTPGVWRLTPGGRAWLAENPGAERVEKHALLPSSAPGSGPGGKVRGDVRTGDLAPKPMAPRQSVRFTIRGESRSLSAEQVRAAARLLIERGLPDEARRFNSWAVRLEGEEIGLKWFFEQLMASSGAFVYQARDILRQLGFEVVQLPRATREENGKVKRGGPSMLARDDWRNAATEQVTRVRLLIQGRAERPTDERLCDLVLFCYLLGLYEEACSLFRLVDEAHTHPWQYARTSKMARICELRIMKSPS